MIVLLLSLVPRLHLRQYDRYLVRVVKVGELHANLRRSKAQVDRVVEVNVDLCAAEQPLQVSEISALDHLRLFGAEKSIQPEIKQSLVLDLVKLLWQEVQNLLILHKCHGGEAKDM